MTTLSPDQRNYLYILEAERVGIHKSILAALYQAHEQPSLTDGETGLGISPANRIPLEQVNTFAGQIQYGANTIRALSDSLTKMGWQGVDLWDANQGHYTKKFLDRIAIGYAPSALETTAARLEPCRTQQLWEAYLEDLKTDFQFDELSRDLAYLDSALLSLIERIPRYYEGLSHQRDALLEVVRIWRQLDTRTAAIDSLKNGNQPSESELDRLLLQFSQNVSRHYLGYPHQREALIRLTQMWRQLDSREQAIASLENNTSADPGLSRLDPALIAFVQRIPRYYQGKGTQRQALTEALRLWRRLDSRSAALVALGIHPKTLNASASNPTALANAATQLDRELLGFIQRIPFAYEEQDHQRDALIRLVQFWRGLDTRQQAINSLLEDGKRMNGSRSNSPEAPPLPNPIVLPRPDRWTPHNLQMHASIIVDGAFTWAEATHGGTRMPPNQGTVDAIIRIAKLAQQARDRIGRPFLITSWYRPPDINRRVGGVSNSRHIVGDAIDFYCDGLTGNQIYWFLDPWWPGGLGRYASFPYLSHIDARSYRARWVH